MNRPGSMRIVVLLGSIALGWFLTPAATLAAPPGAIDGGACIASDALGYRYIGFGRTGVSEPGIYLATNRSGTWRVSARPIAAGERCAAMVIDGARHVHLLSLRLIPNDPNEHDELLYTTNRTGSWRTSFVRTGEIGFASLALDRTGRANVAGTDVDGAFLFERSASGGWVSRYDITGRTSHLRADPAGNLWVVMSDAANRRFVRLTDRGGAWVASVVPVPYSDRIEVDLAIDGSGRRYVATHDPATGGVTIRRDRGATWPRADRTRTAAGRTLMEMDIEPSGAIHLSFRRTKPRQAVVDLNHHGGKWRSQLVGYSSGFWSDIEIDGRGRVSAAYERDGVVWSYRNPWTKPATRFSISRL